mmetsp:Transcript_71932/g.233816  ORF Transcript_71932/g.233816 Transcript_71932/m.233816 type:complete len:209 (+) Transcript_71932:2168-2794(+)
MNQDDVVRRGQVRAARRFLQREEEQPGAANLLVLEFRQHISPLPNTALENHVLDTELLQGRADLDLQVLPLNEANDLAEGILQVQLLHVLHKGLDLGAVLRELWQGRHQVLTGRLGNLRGVKRVLEGVKRVKLGAGHGLERKKLGRATSHVLLPGFQNLAQLRSVIWILQPLRVRRLEVCFGSLVRIGARPFGHAQVRTQARAPRRQP